MTQLDLLDAIAATPKFDGATYDHDRDHARLSTQLEKVREAMKSGRWFTLSRLAEIAGGTEASASARLRDLRKEKFGGLTIEREHVARGLFRYRMLP